MRRLAPMCTAAMGQKDPVAAAAIACLAVAGVLMRQLERSRHVRVELSPHRSQHSCRLNGVNIDLSSAIW